jgi:integrase
VSYKLENLPRNRRGEYGIKARVPGVAAKSFRARTANEARKAALRWIEGVESGVERTSAEITLAEYRAEIADGMRWSPGTRRSYDGMWRRYIEPRFGRDPLSTIGRSEIREWLARMKREGATANTCRETLVSLMVLLNEAVRDGKLAAAPNTRGLRPGIERRRGVALTGAQGQLLLEALPERYKTVAIVGISTGMRIGEILALRPEDFHRDTMTISVTKSVSTVAQGGSLLIADRKTKGTKTKAGRREVPLFPGVLAAVDDHIERFGISPEGYLFTTYLAPHSWLSYGAFKQAWDQTVRRLRTDDDAVPRFGRHRHHRDPDFPDVKIHDMRKTFGSWMVANPNVTPMEAARVLGHKNASITLDVYAQLIDGRSAIPAAQSEMLNLFGIGDPKELAPAIIEGEVVDGELEDDEYDEYDDLLDFAKRNG